MKQPTNRIQLIRGDITRIKADAIVNTANSSLLGGGGVDGAIHRAGGPEVLKECKEIVARQGECPTGEAVITTAGNLPAKYVIHTVGPVWYGDNKSQDGSPAPAEKLSSCYTNSLALAQQNHCKTIAFPCISTGVYHFPKKQAAEIAVKTVRKFLDQNKDIDTVFLVAFDEENYEALKEELGEVD